MYFKLKMQLAWVFFFAYYPCKLISVQVNHRNEILLTKVIISEKYSPSKTLAFPHSPAFRLPAAFPRGT